MDGEILNGIKFGFGIIISLSLFFGIVFAVGIHTTSEILPGVFQGDYTFNGNLSVSGDLNLSGNSTGIFPSGMTVSFNSSTCPTGWVAGSYSPTESDAIPDMTSNTAPSGNATSSTVSGSLAPWKALDDDSGSTYWSPATRTNEWFQYEFDSSIVTTKYTIRARSVDSNDANMAPSTWDFLGWNGSGWDTLDSQSGISGWSGGLLRTYTFSNVNNYSIYRFDIANNVAGPYQIAVGEFEIYGTVIDGCIKI